MEKYKIVNSTKCVLIRAMNKHLLEIGSLAGIEEKGLLKNTEGQGKELKNLL
jgi:hypothetical protein